jgi:glutathione synthase/RimK-type ligase-like ATP-grasp enzyme
MPILKTLLYPYNPASKSAKTLALLLGVKRMRHAGSKVKLNRVQVINWGSSTPPAAAKVINRESIVASNKLATFMILQTSPLVNNIPEWTTYPAIAKEWLTKGKRVFARTILNGHSGNGIINVKGKDGILPDAPLYVEYVPKSAEYRVHVCNGEAFLIQQKKKKAGEEVKDKYIRSHKNGYVFCKHDLEVPDGLCELAVRAVQILVLDFGAVDIIHGKDGKLYILEVNTAPGLDNSTAQEYKNALSTYL